MSNDSNNEEKNQSKEGKNQNSFKNNLKDSISCNCSFITIIVSLVLILTSVFFITKCQEDNTKNYISTKINEIRQSTNNYKLDSLTNHRLITLEINQNSYSSNINFYSIFITVLISLVLIAVGYSVYFNNKENVKKLEEKHHEFDKRQIELEEKHQEFILKQEELESYVDKHKTEMNELYQGFKYYFHEIFDALQIFYWDKYNMIKDTDDEINKLNFLSNALMYNLISRKSLNINREKFKGILIDSRDEIITQIKLIDLVKGFQNRNIDLNSWHIDILIENFKDSLKHANEDDSDIKEIIKEIIKQIDSYKLMIENISVLSN